MIEYVKFIPLSEEHTSQRNFLRTTEHERRWM